MFDIADMVNRWLAENQPIALATVVETWGSSPRPTGAKMAVTADLAMIGSVSGGCVEGVVIEEATASLKDKRPRLLHFGVSDDTAWEVGLTCGGKISVYVEPLDTQWWAQVTEQAGKHQLTATINVLEGEIAGQKVLVDAAGSLLYATGGLSAEQLAALLEAGAEVFTSKQSIRKQIAGLDVLIDVHRPQPKLVMIGAVHVAMALGSFAQQLGFRPILIDPRTAFATPERFPTIETILQLYPDKAFAEIGIDAETYIAVLTHDPKIDDPALQIALCSPAPYIGVLSSKRAHEKRTQRLIEQGVDPALLARLRTPIGLNIGAQTPEEIALCIMAEIVAVRNGAS
jgi:xanthine dehydrogenase accessory factor